MKARAALPLLFIAMSALHAKGNFVDFNASFTALPYTESGLTFSTLPGTNSAVVASGHMISGTNFIPIHIRVTAEQPFALTSIDIHHFYRSWRIEASSGAVVTLLNAGVINFAELPGWSSIAYFDIVHDPAEANGGVQVDRVDFAIPASSLLGDFNTDGIVNASDYVVWRSKIGTQAGYKAWRAHFGQVAGMGSVSSPVPEPSAACFVVIAAVIGVAIRRR